MEQIVAHGGHVEDFLHLVDIFLLQEGEVIQFTGDVQLDELVK